MALLIQFLVCFDAAAGRNIHYAVEATRRHRNEYPILIGPQGRDANAQSGTMSSRF